jgi:hypothetical protein
MGIGFISPADSLVKVKKTVYLFIMDGLKKRNGAEKHGG